MKLKLSSSYLASPWKHLPREPDIRINNYKLKFHSHSEISAHSNLPYCKVWYKKLKSLNLGPKAAGLRILRLEFENITVIFESATFVFV